MKCQSCPGNSTHFRQHADRGRVVSTLAIAGGEICLWDSGVHGLKLVFNSWSNSSIISIYATSKWNHVPICSGIWLGVVRQQTNTRAIIAPILYRHMAPPGHNELMLEVCGNKNVITLVNQYRLIDFWLVSEGETKYATGLFCITACR